MSSAVIRGSRPRAARVFALRYTASVLGLAALYAVTGRAGLLLAQTQENATLIWAPTGLALAALVLRGPRLWPGVLLGAALTNASIGTPALPLAAIAIGNTLEAVVGWLLLTRVARLDTGFARLRDVLAFLFFGVLVSTTVSATIGVGGLSLGGELAGEGFGSVWLIWWLGDAGGAAVVAPLILVAVDGRPPWGALIRKGEAWVALSVLTGLMALSFGGALSVPWESLLLALLAFPLVVWIGLRLGPRGAVVGSFVAGTSAVVGTARGTGPFVGAGLGNDLFLLWAYIFALGTVAMILAAAIAEGEDSEDARRAGDAERAKMALQLQHVQRLESLGLLAGGIAHDFNNLLVAIRCNAELLKRHPEVAAERGDELLGAIETASDQAAELCRQLLTYAGENRPEKAPADLGALVREMAPLLETSVGEGTTLELDTGSVTAVLGDKGQLGQVLLNLVLNAAQATNDGGTVTVSLETRAVSEAELRETFLRSEVPAGRFVVLEVSDDGSGMAPEVLERIFDPFFTTKREGRGLGMPSVLGIVRAHEGAIKVRSEVGEGTCFEILLPVLEGVAVAVTERPPEQRPEARTGAVTVLLAEDNDQVRRVAQLLLRNAGFTVVAARDGAEALELFEADPSAIDVLLFDVKMPRMSGPDALKAIRARSPDFPAVLMSGYDAGLTRAVAGVTFVNKPFDTEALLTTLREAVGEVAPSA
jgi:signal transduction histidine kinase/CheY-like chemotaxis protein